MPRLSTRSHRRYNIHRGNDVTRHMTARRRAATVAGVAVALMFLAIPGTAIPGMAFADPAPIGNAHFTRAGAPLFAYPVGEVEEALDLHQRSGAAVSRALFCQCFCICAGDRPPRGPL